MKLHLTDEPLHDRPFYGLGVEADGVLYNENNRRSGVSEEDIERVEERIVALRPGVARMFFQVQKICPELDPEKMDVDSGEFQRNLRMLRVLGRAGASVNAVLFQPFGIETERLPEAVRCMIRILKHLREREACEHIHWLTLYNEPESAFPHDSELVRRVFSEEKRNRHHTWEDYVDLNRYAQERLEAEGLYPDIRLAVADTVWGAGMRKERMQLSAEAFGDMDVTYAYHNYNPEALDYYETAHPDFYYDGMGAEAEQLRGMVGAEAPLVVWEFNLAGTGFGTYYPGVDERGCCVTETHRAGARLAHKVFEAIRGGVDGFCLWCVGDMYYYGDPASTGVMRFGLWRYRYEDWRVRPYAYYYAALCHALRPGIQLRRMEGLDAPLSGVCWEFDGRRGMALVNNGHGSREVEVSAERDLAPGRGLSIGPSDIGPDTAFPLEDWRECPPPDRRRLKLTGHELLMYREGRQGW